MQQAVLYLVRSERNAVTRQTSMCSLQQGGVVVAYAHCAHLARLYSFRQCIHELVNFTGRCGHMDLIEINALDTQTLKAIVQRLEQVSCRRTGRQRSKFAGNDNGAPIRSTTLAQYTLRFASPIHFSRIKKVEA